MGVSHSMVAKSHQTRQKIPSNHQNKIDKRTINSIFTQELVTRVADRVGKGMTVAQALVLEDQDVNEMSFHSAIRRKPELGKIFLSRQAIFVEQALEIIQAGDSKDVRRIQGFQWILERRHREQFGRHDSGVHITNNILNGVPVDMMGQLRDRANKLSRGAKLAIGAPATETYYARKKRERLAAKEIIHAKPIDVEEIKPS